MEFCQMCCVGCFIPENAIYAEQLRWFEATWLRRYFTQ
jgi:hypothetical protein